ncbi:interferon gamma receptor 1 isoform X2 [Puntigrus tetrazona]|uniref:interferon gamma receptor 1 isoform X2 n=1 Tax=Puntigrus tetrazona TaxID=1606681 RepID=UPI001C89F286|nr:interferon gamma receptor 1 isoform X2 [Puntigrus tetrazona]
MRIQIYIGVSVLMLIQKTASEAASLPSPAKVSVRCDSYGAEVRWEYPGLAEDVYFQVKVKDEFGERDSNLTQNLLLNISSMLFSTAYNRYYVNVTAVRGGEKSEPSSSDDFSYNEFSLVNIKCHLDFPEVKLSPKDGKLHVRFVNPLRLYRRSPVLRDVTDDLLYNVQTEKGKTFKSVCKMDLNASCETSVEFTEHVGKYCINLTGGIGQRLFNLKSTCFTGDIRNYIPVTVYIYSALGAVSTLLVITVVIMLLARKCNSDMKRKVFSMFHHFFDFGEMQSHQAGTLHVEQDNVVNVLIEPVKDHVEQTKLTPFIDTENLESGKSEERSYGPSDLVEDERSNQSDFYDCPHAPRQTQEMSPGDTVHGYGPSLLLDM